MKRPLLKTALSLSALLALSLLLGAPAWAGSCQYTQQTAAPLGFGPIRATYFQRCDNEVNTENDCRAKCDALENYGCAYFEYPDCKNQPSSVMEIVQDLDIKEPILQINWPGLNFTDLKNAVSKEEGGGRYLLFPWAGEFLATVYRFGLGIVSIVAVVMIIIEGIKIVVSGAALSSGGEGSAAHYKRIAQVLIGLTLAWSSYLILYNINPALVEFKSLRVLMAQPQAMPELHIYEDTEAPFTETPQQTTTGWVKIEISNAKTGEELSARPDLVNALKLALAEYGRPVSITDAGRSPAKQYFYMKKHCGCKDESQLPQNVKRDQWKLYCGKVTGCQASTNIERQDGQFVGPNAGHIAGNAVDVSASASNSYILCRGADEKEGESDGVIHTASKPFGYCVPQEQQELIRVMLKYGFCVGLKYGSSVRESWHFELLGNGVKPSGFCTNNLNDKNLQKLKYL